MMQMFTTRSAARATPAAMRARSLVIALAVSITMGAASSVATAGRPSPGGCPDGFTLHDANENPDWPQHRDRNGDGMLCVKTTGGGGDLVIDNR